MEFGGITRDLAGFGGITRDLAGLRGIWRDLAGLAGLGVAPRLFKQFYIISAINEL